MKDKFSKLLQENLKKEQEKKWDNRFFLYKIPQYDAFKDPNYISLSLMKTKTKYDEKNAKKNEANLKKRIYSTHYSINSLNKKNPSQNKLHHEDSFQRNQLNQKRPKSIYSRLDSFPALTFVGFRKTRVAAKTSILQGI